MIKNFHGVFNDLLWVWKIDDVINMAPAKKLWKSHLANVKWRYFEPVTMISPLVNWGNNTQGIYIFLNMEGDDLL